LEGVAIGANWLKLILSAVFALIGTVAFIILKFKQHKTINLAEDACTYMVNPIIIIKEDILLSSDISWRYIGEEFDEFYH